MTAEQVAGKIIDWLAGPRPSRRGLCLLGEDRRLELAIWDSLHAEGLVRSDPDVPLGIARTSRYSSARVFRAARRVAGAEPPAAPVDPPEVLLEPAPARGNGPEAPSAHSPQSRRSTDDLLAAYRAGEPVRGLARRFGISPQRLFQLRRRAGVPVCPRIVIPVPRASASGLLCGECGADRVARHPEFSYLVCRRCWWICDAEGQQIPSAVVSAMVRRVLVPGRYGSGGVRPGGRRPDPGGEEDAWGAEDGPGRDRDRETGRFLGKARRTRPSASPVLLEAAGG